MNSLENLEKIFNNSTVEKREESVENKSGEGLSHEKPEKSIVDKLKDFLSDMRTRNEGVRKEK